MTEPLPTNPMPPDADIDVDTDIQAESATPEKAAPAESPSAFSMPPTPPPDPDPEILLPPVEKPAAAPPSSPRHWYSLGGESPLDAPRDVAEPDGMIPTIRTRRHETTRDRVRRRKLRRERGIPDSWASMVIVSALVGVTTVIGLMLFFMFRAANSTGSVVVTSVPQEPTSIFYGAAGGALGDQSMVINPWEGDKRFTVLVLGKDKRPGEFGNAFLTDTMILISLDPQRKQVGILSIPRDLQVEVPDYGLQQVNTAYRLGELEGPGGGPTLAMLTVQYNLGIPVNDYMVVDFETFIRVIDEIGGINVEVKTTIDDPQYPDMNYGYDPFYLEAGWHLLDGKTALKFARTRHQTDDIDRAYRQQQVLYAIRDKVVSAGMLPELVAKAYPLYADIKDGIDTSMSLDQMLELAWFVKDVERTNIKSGVIGWDYIIAENWDGRPIIRPDRDMLPQLLTEVFGPNFAAR